MTRIALRQGTYKIFSLSDNNALNAKVQEAVNVYNDYLRNSGNGEEVQADGENTEA
jgi:hypothetical protein